jgi:dTDP-glucose 4,6-dehydratase
MRAVVTGGAGFVGSHVCERLLGRGFEVVAVDNFVTGSPQNLVPLGHLSGFEFIEADVSVPLDIPGPIDRILHLASPASPVAFDTIPIQILDVGTAGTRNMLELASAKGARFLMASTSEVYGDPAVHPQPESYWGNVNPIGLRSCYDEAKRCAEAYTMAYHRSKAVDTRIIRIFNTFGPRMDTKDGRVIPNYVSQALAGEALTVFGDGSQTRSLCYVDDLVSGILAVLEGDDPMPFNLGTQHEVTMLELAHLIRKLTGTSSEVRHLPLPQDDPKLRRPDTERAQRILGWTPQVPIEDGLIKTIDYFRSILKTPSLGEAGE